MIITMMINLIKPCRPYRICYSKKLFEVFNVFNLCLANLPIWDVGCCPFVLVLWVLAKINTFWHFLKELVPPSLHFETQTIHTKYKLLFT